MNYDDYISFLRVLTLNHLDYEKQIDIESLCHELLANVVAKLDATPYYYTKVNYNSITVTYKAIKYSIKHTFTTRYDHYYFNELNYIVG